ncbi:putative PAP-specific phosphatase, mitochondrial [Lolium rigidum]|uniref:putative PAP-specific phosphatase, mitochondrial n=1 Tax=Lolium rigidum TaxID=89674 RepID=UPI001F5CE63A|nr:putative PAP-specific phosphatase, mitochondrial [Lolium rigidum]
MPLLHLSLPRHRLLLGQRRSLIAPPMHPPSRLSVRAAAAAVHEACALPFPPSHAPHHRELAAAMASVERACRLCVDVKETLLSNDRDKRRVVEKNDQTHVTTADFGVQALISFELQQLFPSIPLVAEEDSTFLRSPDADAGIVDSISSFVARNVSNNGSTLTHDDVLRAIDRGGREAVSFDSKPATYWILDPIDGTKGFLKGNDTLYVVGLALVVDGKLAVGVMGCPNWSNATTIVNKEDESAAACHGDGMLMVSHVGCGTWSRPLSAGIGQFTTPLDAWTRCSVDPCSVLHMARFCIVDSHTWDMMPLSAHFDSTMDESEPRDENKILLQNSCGGSLSKYLMVACGRMSVFILLARAAKLLKTWDHAVGVICVEEAGGQTCDWSGKPLDFAAERTGRRIIYPTGGILSTNAALHDKLVEMVSENYK